MAEVTTKIYHNTTDQNVNVIGVGEIRAHDHVSITTKYHQPVVLENYPGIVEVTDMTPDEQQAFYANEQAHIDAHAAPRVEQLKQADDALNAAEAAAKGMPAPAPVPRFDAVSTPVTPPANDEQTQGAEQ